MTMEANAVDRRRQTRGGIYRCLYENREPCTKAFLAQQLGLSLPTVYQSLSELQEAGLVCYAGEAQSTGGRRAQSLTIVSDARIAVGVSITEDRIRMVLTDLRLNELAYRKVRHSLLWRTDAFADLLAGELEEFLDSCHADRSRLLGVGIAIPGVFSTDRERLIIAPTLGLQGTDLNALVSRIPYPVFLENDGNCGGRAEWFIRGGRSNMAYLSLENGVGGAVFIGGTPYLGSNGRSGEFGHMCVEPAGLPCKCGKRGCLEAYCSALRIHKTLGVSRAEFFEGLAAHIPEYEALWHDMLRHLAVGVDAVRMALDCDVVLGGFLTEHLPPYMSQLREYVAANNTFEPDADYIQLSVLRRHSVPLGAALHYIQEFLNSY